MADETAEPSDASLSEIPPMDPAKPSKVFRGPGALKAALAFARDRRGRPRKGEKPLGTATKSVRLSVEQWQELERLAEQEGTTVHALIRAAIAAMLERAA